MTYDPDLAQRIRATIGADTGVDERKMFGGLAFLLRGNLAASAYKDGGLMIRCSSEDWQGLCAEEGARPMLRRGKPVSGWVLVRAEEVSDDASLEGWLQRGLRFAASQTPK